MKYLLFLTLSFNLYALPDFRVVNVWANNNCSHVYATFANKGTALPHSYYDREVHARKFFLIRTSKIERKLYLDEVDPNHRMASHDGYATIELTPYLNIEKGLRVEVMVNYGYTIEESKYGKPNYDSYQFNCPNLPEVVEGPLQVSSWYVMPNSRCSIKVNLRNPNSEFLSIDAWNSEPNKRVSHHITVNNMIHNWVNMHIFDPEKKLRPAGGVVGYTYNSNLYESQFVPGDSKYVRIHSYWPGINNSSLYDQGKLLHCGPDLSATYEIFPQYPKKGDRFHIRLKVRNQGTDTSGTSSVTIKFGGETNPQVFSLPVLNPRKHHYIRRSFTINRPGRYRVKVKLDHNNQNNEYNENNNDLEFSINVSQ